MSRSVRWSLRACSEPRSRPRPVGAEASGRTRDSRASLAFTHLHVNTLALRLDLVLLCYSGAATAELLADFLGLDALLVAVAVRWRRDPGVNVS